MTVSGSGPTPLGPLVERHSQPLSRCPICGSGGIGFAYWSYFENQRIRYERCRACGYVFQNPMLSQPALTQIYQSRWYWGLEKEADAGYLNYLADRDSFVKDYRRRFRRLIAAGLPRRGRLLDVGCGAGYSALVAMELGFSVLGVEPSPDMVRFAERELGVVCFQGLLEEFRCDPGSFDLVTTWGTANNFRDPVAMFGRMHEAVKPGGVVVTDFLDLDSPFSLLVEAQFRRAIAAMGRPTKRSMGILFRKAGFETVTLIPYVPYFSLSHILQMSPNPIRKLGHRMGLRRWGVYVPVIGYYLVVAGKATNL